MTSSSTIQTCRADYGHSQHAAAPVGLMDVYARDPAGGGKALSEFIKVNLVAALAARPHAFSVLAFDGGAAGHEAIGLLNCLEGFSTFACQPRKHPRCGASRKPPGCAGKRANAGLGRSHCARTRCLQIDAGGAARQPQRDGLVRAHWLCRLSTRPCHGQCAIFTKVADPERLIVKASL